MLAPSRMARLAARVAPAEWQVADMSEGEVIAMSWTCETLGLSAAAEAAPEQVLWMDFDRFLTDPVAGLAQAMRHLRGKSDEHEIRAMLAAQDLRRYSKAPEHAYDTGLRRDVLNQARCEHGDEIRRGLAWLERAAGQSPVIRNALDRASAHTT